MQATRTPTARCLQSCTASYDGRRRAACAGGAPATRSGPRRVVHETFIRLAGAHHVDWQDRKHFLAVAGRTMRRLLVDLAREQASAKRGSRAVHVPLDSGVAAGGLLPVDLVALDRALESLAALDARKVQVVELKFFAGLTVEETADVLNVSPDTVARDWRMARTWLLRELSTAKA